MNSIPTKTFLNIKNPAMFIFLICCLCYQHCLADESTEQVVVKEPTTIEENDSSGFDDDAFSGFVNEDTDENHASKETKVSDPLRPYNEVMFNINLVLDNHISKPITETYVEVTHPELQSGVSNFFNNIKEPWVSINLLLQGRMVESLEVLSRFTINTITTAGFGDPSASILNLRRYQEDFGQTLGVWGIPSGPFIVLPMFGPSTLRDASAKFLIDSQGNAISYVDGIEAQLALYGVLGLEKRASLMRYEGILEPSYELVRDAYLQKREFDINGHKKSETQNKNQTDDTEFEEGFGD